MEGGGYGGGNRVEAERWLYTANKVLTARDLHGARSFAIRARESDPKYEPTELLLTVIDTLMAGEAWINDHLDWYAILQVLRYTQNIDYIAAQFRRLAAQLDPSHNPFAYAAHAFTLVHDAWSVLSNPNKKALYDNQIRFISHPSPPPPPPPPPPVPAPAQQQPPPPPVPVSFFPVQPSRTNLYPVPTSTPMHVPWNQTESTVRVERASEESNVSDLTRPSEVLPESVTDEKASFWTACPYCYAMYEYLKKYEDCTLRCQNCRRGFHALVVPTPPVLDGQDGSFCSWGFFPVGFSGDFKDICGSGSKWNPFSPLFPFPLKGDESSRSWKENWVIYDEEESAEFAELSDTTQDDSDDYEWSGVDEKVSKRRGKRRKKGSNVGAVDVRRVSPIERPRRGVHNSAGKDNVPNGETVDGGVLHVPESTKKTVLAASRRRSERNLGKLDLNVEFSNEVEEPVNVVGERNGSGNGAANGNAEDNIEGIGFFEGLDEFLNSFPILNVVADDKVKGH